MKKGLKVTGLALGILSVATIGGYFGASATTGNWKTDVINDSYSGFLDVASSKVNSLTQDIDGDIDKKVQSEIGSTVDNQEKELQRLLDEYYQLKLDGFADTDEFKELEEKIKTIRQNVYESYKKQIDDAFANKQ